MGYHTASFAIALCECGPSIFLNRDTGSKDGWLSLDGKGLTTSFTVSKLIVGMPDDFTLDQVDDFFSNIGRVIGNAFQMP